MRRFSCSSECSSSQFVRLNLRAAVAIFTLLLLAAALSLSGCTKKGADMEITTASGEKLKLASSETMRVRIISEPPSLDWQKATDVVSAHVTDNLMDGLIEYDFSKKEPELKPALATKWESKDNRVWKITLRTDVVWSDGQPFTAQHVVDGFQRLLDPKTASEYSYFLFPLKNGKPYSLGQIKDFAQVGAKVSAANEVTVELEKPIAYFPFLLTHHSTFPIRLDVVNKFGDQWTEPANIVTTGPFKMVSWEHDKQVVVTRNERYYGNKPKLKNVVFMMIQEVATAINIFDAKKIDCVDRLPPQQMQQLKNRPEFRAIPALWIQFYGFNVQKAPMDNPLVRRAISHAIDRQEIVTLINGGEIPMTSFIPVGVFSYEADRGLGFNVEKAKELLKQAGYGDKKKFPKIEFTLNIEERNQLVAENIQAQLKRNLGIDLEIKAEEWKVFLVNLRVNPSSMFRSGWIADYPDPDAFMSLMTSYSENNRTRWKNKTYDDLVEKAAAEGDKEKRRQMYSTAQKLLVEEEVPVIPLYTAVNHYLISDRIQNYPFNLLDRRRYTEVTIK